MPLGFRQVRDVTNGELGEADGCASSGCEAARAMMAVCGIPIPIGTYIYPGSGSTLAMR
jgi:hypothetical protein